MNKVKNLLSEAEDFARETLKANTKKDLLFHTIVHTEQVVDAIKEIAPKSGVSEEDQEILLLAGWFHDLGYIEVYDGHEEVSKRLAKDFFTEKGAAPDLIDRILALIEATKLDHQPGDMLEKVIKDADLYNLCTDEALDYTRKLRVEWKAFKNQEYTDIEWYELNLSFFNNYVFYTDYANSVLVPKKHENVLLLQKRLKKAKKKEKQSVQYLSAELSLKQQEVKKLSSKLEKAKIQKPDRGIETMFRTTYRVHMDLSSIADNKANILLSINSLILSFGVISLLGQLEDEPILLFPVVLLTVISLGSMVFAILATRPKVNSGVFTREDILQKRTNLLFFGNFHNMPLEDYSWGIQEMMRDSSYLYGSMSKDVYFLGVVLAKKFRLLRIAYNIFMYGMIATVLIFAVLYGLDAASSFAGS